MVNCRIAWRSLYKRNNKKETIWRKSRKKQKQAVREREAEEAGGNFLKADGEKSLKVTEENCGDLGNVYSVHGLNIDKLSLRKPGFPS